MSTFYLGDWTNEFNLTLDLSFNILDPNFEGICPHMILGLLIHVQLSTVLKHLKNAVSSVSYFIANIVVTSSSGVSLNQS